MKLPRSLYRLSAALTNCTVLLTALGCGSASVATPLPAVMPMPLVMAPPPPKPKPICAVLSVGAEKGIAHIGVLDAMKFRGIAPSCVFGNSMGALVGGLYAYAPNYDLRTQYRAVMHEYVRRTEKEAADGGFLGAILLGGLVIVTGGTAATAVTIAAPGGAVIASSVKRKDKARLVGVLNTHTRNADIAALPIEYASWYAGFDPEPAIVPMTRGNLAGAIGSSVANPLIFPDLKVKTGVRLDPGADRMAAVPLEDACKIRPDAHFIVSNVTGRPVYFSTAMTCSYQVIEVATPDAEAVDVLMANGPSYDAMIWAGYNAGLSALPPVAPDAPRVYAQGYPYSGSPR